MTDELTIISQGSQEIRVEKAPYICRLIYPGGEGLQYSEKGGLWIPYSQVDHNEIGLSLGWEVNGIPKEGKPATGDAALLIVEAKRDQTDIFAIVTDGISDPMGSDIEYAKAAAKAFSRLDLESMIQGYRVLLKHPSAPFFDTETISGYCGLSPNVLVDSQVMPGLVPGDFQDIPLSIFLDSIEKVSQLITDELQGLEAFGPFSLFGMSLRRWHDFTSVRGSGFTNLDCKLDLKANGERILVPSTASLVNRLDDVIRGLGHHPLDDNSRLTKARNFGALPCNSFGNLTGGFVAFNAGFSCDLQGSGFEIGIRTDGDTPDRDDCTRVSFSANMQVREI